MTEVNLVREVLAVTGLQHPPMVLSKDRVYFKALWEGAQCALHYAVLSSPLAWPYPTEEDTYLPIGPLSQAVTSGPGSYLFVLS